MKIWAITLNTFREAIRNKILYTILFFVACLIGASAFFGSVTIGDQGQVIKDFGLFSLSVSGAILTLVIGVSLLHKELKQKTIYNILSKPVERWEFVIGKYCGLVITTQLLVALMGLGLFIFLGLFEHRADWLLFQGILYVLFEVCILAAVVIFFSAIAVTTTLPGLLTLATYIVGHSVAYLSYFVNQSQNVTPLTKVFVLSLSWVLPNLNIFNANERLVYGIGLTLAEVSYACLYALGYSTLLLILASAIFRRRELN